MTPTVLLVDDNDDLRELMVLRLQMAKIPTLEARDGLEALKILTSDGPPIVLCDVRMPRMSGPELLRAVRDNGGDQLFIFFSGDLARAQISEMVPLGVFEILEKGTSEGIVDVVRAAEEFLQRDF